MKAKEEKDAKKLINLATKEVKRLEKQVKKGKGDGVTIIHF